MRRIQALDGLRGLAILLVLAFHFRARPEFLLESVFRIGWIGLDLFFVLSGYLITSILLESREQPRYYRNFYVRRVLRIFPLYYGFLFLFLKLDLIPHRWLPIPILAGNLIVASNQVYWWSYLSNIYYSMHDFTFGFFAVFWTLAMEEQFYLIWPAIVRRFSRPRLIRLCYGLIGVALIARSVCVGWDIQTSAAYVFPLCRMDALVLGALIAVRPIRGRILFFVGAAIFVVCYIDGNFDHRQKAMQVVGYTALDAAFAGLIAWMLISPLKVFEGAFLRFFGKYSYGMYVFHTMIWDVSVHFVQNDWLRVLAAVSATIAIAWVSWHCYENQFLRLKSIIAPRRGEPPRK